VKHVTSLGQSFANPITAAKAFLQFKEELCSCVDEWAKFSMTFLDMYNLFTRFCMVVAIGDSVAIEACYIAFLPYFNYCGKNQYTELVLRQAEALYGESLTSWQLHSQQCNHGI
jgi:hypothetical protein